MNTKDLKNTSNECISGQNLLKNIKWHSIIFNTHLYVTQDIQKLYRNIILRFMTFCSSASRESEFENICGLITLETEAHN